MMTESPREKAGWHFPSDGVHKALYVWAYTIEEAEKIYHRSKELMTPLAQSTPPAAKEGDEVQSS